MKDIARDALKLAKTVMAGSMTFPVYNKIESEVTVRRIMNAMKKTGYLLEAFDFSKLEWDTMDLHRMFNGVQGAEVIWRVFPVGKVGDRNSEYVWGTVRAGLTMTGKGARVYSAIYVRD